MNRDTQWLTVQEKTFTKWVNTRLKKYGYDEITNIYDSISETLPLLHLLEIIGGTKFNHYNEKPKHKVHYLENVDMALKYIKHNGVTLTNIGPEDIVDKNKKLILGLIWSIILRFSLQEISEGELKAKEALLLWSKRVTEGYKGVEIRDFTTSWQDGLAFCAILHRYHPEMLEFKSLDKKKKRDNLVLAFDIGAKLGIEKLLDPEDLLNFTFPDEKSIITYVSQYFHTFAPKFREEIAAKRLTSFLTHLNHVQTVNTSYHKEYLNIKERLNKIKTELSQKDTELSSDEMSVDTLIEIKEYLSQYQNDKSNISADMDNLKKRYGDLIDSTTKHAIKIQDKSPDQSILDINKLWSELIAIEKAYYDKYLDGFFAVIKDLRDRHFNINKEIRQTIDNYVEEINNEEIDNRTKYNKINELEKYINNILKSELGKKVSLKKMKEIEDDLIQIESDSQLKGLTTSQKIMESELKTILELLDKQKSSVKPMESDSTKKGAFLTSEQESEIQTIYNHFKNKEDDTIQPLGFQVACSCVGHSIHDDQVAEIYDQAKTGEHLTYDDFKVYMSRILTTIATPEMIMDSLSHLSTDNKTISRQKLENIGVKSNILDTLFHGADSILLETVRNEILTQFN